MDNQSLIILGAGAPYSGETPAVLRQVGSGISALEWIFGACGCSISNTTFIAGYQSKIIRSKYPELNIIENSNWEETGSGASFLLSTFDNENPAIVCYGDILFREKSVQSLVQCSADVAVAWDSTWQSRFVGRDHNTIVNSEKVIVDGGIVKRLGVDIPLDWADGEFIGLVRFSPKALKWISSIRKKFPQSLKTSHLSDYIEYMRVEGLSVEGVDVNGQCAEFNEPRDIAHFILGTKAETLSRLRGIVQCSVIQDQIVITVSEWSAKKDNLISYITSYFGDQKLVVRSSSFSEDSFSESNAGGFTSVLNVSTPKKLKDAINCVVDSYGNISDNNQILIQPMVTDIKMSGVAFTRTLEHGAPSFVINYEYGDDTEAITSGSSSNHNTLYLRRNSEVGSLPDKNLEPLIKALREIEDLLGYDCLDVEFALNSQGVVYILQVRPITVSHDDNSIDDDVVDAAIETAKQHWETLSACPPHLPTAQRTLYGVMPDWNPAEIIGIAPNVLASSLYRFLILDDVWAIQR